MTCKKSLAPDQWWNFCGETDMGQTLPVQCTECGGEYILRTDPNAEQLVKERNEKLQKECDIVLASRKKEDRLRDVTSSHAWTFSKPVSKSETGIEADGFTLGTGHLQANIPAFFEVKQYVGGETPTIPIIMPECGFVFIKQAKPDTLESRIKHVLIGGLLSREIHSDDELDFDAAVDIVDSLIPDLIEALKDAPNETN